MVNYWINLFFEKQKLWKAKNKKSFLYTREQAANPSLFFIMSCGRSGTTLLRKMLMRSNQIHIPPESDDLIPSVISLYLENLQLNWEGRVDLCLDLYQQDKSFKFWNVNLVEYAEELYTLPKDRHQLRTIVDFIYKKHAELYSSSVKYIGDKTPYLILRIDWVLSLYPNAKIIHLYRDGRAVVASRMAVFNETIEQASNRWLWSLKAVSKLKSKGYSNLLEVCYEDLVRKPESSLRKICTFLDLPYSAKMLEDEVVEMGDDVLAHHSNTKESLSVKHIEKWKNQLSEADKLFLDKRLKKQLQKLNYIK